MEKRKWTKEEKLAILKEAEKEGIEVTLRKYGIYSSSYYSWRKKYRLEGAQGLEAQERRKKDGQYIRQLEDEVALLKELFRPRRVSKGTLLQRTTKTTDRDYEAETKK